MAKIYKVFSGNGKLTPTAGETYIDAATVGSLYGLDEADYEIAGAVVEGTPFTDDYINLTPRPDGNYRNIKTELGDNGTVTHYRTMVNPKKWRERNNDINGYSPR